MLLQAGVPSLRSDGGKLTRLKKALADGETLDGWRARQPNAAADFGLLDADGGAGMALVRGLLQADPARRTGVDEALRSKFVR